MKGRRVFVTGGAGVIGQEMVPLLVARGAEVLVGDLKPRPGHFADAVRYRVGDLNAMRPDEIAAFGPEIIIHLAATFERSAETYEFWEQNYRHNVRLSHHLMSLAKDLPTLQRVVFASSYLIYDPSLYQFPAAQSQPVSLREDAPVMPRNLTGMAKLAHEVELRFLADFRSDQFSSVCVRIFRGYGRNSRDVISRWVRSLLAGEEIVVYRPEGLFDYIYAKDSAEGLIRLAEASDAAGIVNLGTGRSRRVREVVDILRSHLPDMRMREAQSDIPFEASEADISLYRSATNWAPVYDLEAAVPEIIAYERTRAEQPSTEAAGGHILLTSAARKIPLVQALRQAAGAVDSEIRVVAGDASADAPARYVADEFWQMPRTVEANLAEILAGCRERGVATIFPSRDGELLFWSRNRERFAAEGIQVVVSPPESVELCLDKLAFAAFGSAKGLPIIPAGRHPDEVGPGPYVVKERFGAGSRAIRLNVSRDEALDHGATLQDPIYQPFVAGDEISIDAWIDREHRPKGVVLRRRDEVVDGESRVTTTFRDSAIEQTAAGLLAALRLRGPVVLQAIVGGKGGIQFIECNSRFGGASTLSLAAGLDSLTWSLLEGRGARPDSFHFSPPDRPIRQVRVPADIYVHDPDL